MNERIRLLAELADKAIRETDLREVNGGIHITPAFVKFAELIVRECVDVIKKEVSMKYKDGSGETEEFMAGHYGGSLLARVVIAQHFGVEK